MDSDRFSRICDLFAQARELDPEARVPFLDGACGEDSDLRIEVEELLVEDGSRNEDAVGRVLSADAELDSGPGAALPGVIGKYRILGLCGSGGMGTVYEAEQDAPFRRVALKVIRAGALQPELLRRFRLETEILARLEHPCIAQIFEAGEFQQDGQTRPFFAMEFVDGVSLNVFASRRELDTAGRIDLFLHVCDAIHYAHERGVIHRDLKPDNILVVDTSSSSTESSAFTGRPKVLDFGVARFAESDLVATVATADGALLGSILYMSPEQAAGKAEGIDARSDLYSLGVVLFELLTSELPYSIRRRSLSDALNTIQLDEPIRLGSIDPRLSGDLETIVGKCLEKDKDRRYESVGALAEDLRRYQDLKPITARPPSTWYQLKKFSQRNRALVGGAATTVLAITAGAILAALLAVNATRHAANATRQAGLAREAQAHSDRTAYSANLGAASALFESDPAHARRILDEIPEESRGWEWQLLSSTLSSLLLEFGEVQRRTPDLFHSIPGEDMHLLANGEEVVALSADDEFRVWQTRTGEVVRTFAAPEDVGVFAASREGNLLAAALEGGRVVTCDPREDEPTWTTWFESDTRVDALAVAPTGDRIAIDRQAEIRFGTPDAWQVVETGARTFPLPPALEFSRDGATLARQFGNVLFLDVATGEVIGEPMESVQGHWAMSIAPDKQRVAIGQMRRELRIFDPATGEMEFELLGHQNQITDVAYGDGNRLLSSSRFDGTIRVWDLERREQIAIFDAPNTTRAEFLDEDHILSLSDGRFRLWTLRDRRARELVGHDGHVFVTVFSGDGELLGSNAPWGEMLVWDALEGTPLYRSKGPLHGYRLAFDREGENIILGPVPDAAQPWYGGPKTSLAVPSDYDKPRLHHSRQNESNEIRIQGSAVPFELEGLHVFRTEHGAQPDGGQVRTFVDGEELALPLPHTSKNLGPHPQLVLGGEYGWFEGSIAELIVFGGRFSEAEATAVDAYLTTRRTGASAELPALDGVLAHFRADEMTVERDEDGAVQRWIASNDSNLVLGARGGPRSGVKFVSAAEGLPAHVRFFQGYDVFRWLEMPIPEAYSAESITVCWLGGYETQNTFLPNAAIRMAYSIETLDVWPSDRDDRIVKIGAGAASSADGRYEARTVAEPKGGSVIVREVATNHCIAHFDGGDYHYWSVSFHPDSRRLACGALDGTIDVFDVETRELVKRFQAHSSQCMDVAYSPDGKLLASAGNDNALRLWDAETYEPLLELPGHRSYVRCLNWSPDGSMLVSGSGDHGVRIWDATPRSERYAQVLAKRALEREVSAQVLELHATEGGDRGAVAQELRRRFGSGAARLRAALKVLARVE